MKVNKRWGMMCINTICLNIFCRLTLYSLQYIRYKLSPVMSQNLYLQLLFPGQLPRYGPLHSLEDEVLRPLFCLQRAEETLQWSFTQLIQPNLFQSFLQYMYTSHSLPPWRFSRNIHINVYVYDSFCVIHYSEVSLKFIMVYLLILKQATNSPRWGDTQNWKLFFP